MINIYYFLLFVYFMYMCKYVRSPVIKLTSLEVLANKQSGDKIAISRVYEAWDETAGFSTFNSREWEEKSNVFEEV